MPGRVEVWKFRPTVGVKYENLHPGQGESMRQEYISFSFFNFLAFGGLNFFSNSAEINFFMYFLLG